MPFQHLSLSRALYHFWKSIMENIEQICFDELFSHSRQQFFSTTLSDTGSNPLNDTSLQNCPFSSGIFNLAKMNLINACLQQLLSGHCKSVLNLFLCDHEPWIEMFRSIFGYFWNVFKWIAELIDCCDTPFIPIHSLSADSECIGKHLKWK